MIRYPVRFKTAENAKGEHLPYCKIGDVTEQSGCFSSASYVREEATTDPPLIKNPMIFGNEGFCGGIFLNNLHTFRTLIVQVKKQSLNLY